MKCYLLLALSTQLILTVPAFSADNRKVNRLVPPPPPKASIITRPVSASRAPEQVPVVITDTAISSKSIVVGSGGPYTFVGTGKEQFSGLLNWTGDGPNSPFFMEIDTTAPGFRWLRIYMGNRILATEKDFRSKTKLQLNLTGTVDNGTQQIVVQGGGNPGSTVKWTVTSVTSVKLNAVNPDEACFGETISLRGENFSMTPAKNIVTIGKTTVPAVSSTTTEIKVKIPTKNLVAGELPVVVTVDGVKSQPVKITVRGIPELTGTNFDGVPPGAELCIFGKNFSKKLKENQVFFENTQAEVLRGTTEELVVTVPNFYNGAGSGSISGQVGIPIRVKVGKVDSKNTVPVTVGNSMWQSPGFRGGPETPTVPVGF